MMSGGRWSSQVGKATDTKQKLMLFTWTQKERYGSAAACGFAHSIIRIRPGKPGGAAPAPGATLAGLAAPGSATLPPSL